MTNRWEFRGDRARIMGELIEPAQVFECGQCFRFVPKDGVYTGVAHGRVLHVRKIQEGMEIYPTTQQEMEEIWWHYFDLGFSYEKMMAQFAGDETIQASFAYAKGLRVLNQPPFETIISFIISANNNIKRIGGIIRRMCERWGRPISFEGQVYYDFPTAQMLGEQSEKSLREIGLGYRAPYIKKTCCAILDGFDLDAPYHLDYSEAKEMLMELSGVGPKVADCILLFAYEKKSAFPRDVWIKRALKTFYGEEPKNDRELVQLVNEKFGQYGGIVQQYLFQYARLQKIV